MHQYFKSIGLSEYRTNASIRKLKMQVLEKANRKSVYSIGEEEFLFCYEKDYGECFGVCITKVGSSEEESDIDHIFPYVRGYNYLFNEKFDIEHCSDHEGYHGVCDDNNIGIPLIFYINDSVGLYGLNEYHKEEQALNCVTLSALGSEGIILLPIYKEEYQKKFERQENEIRNEMISAAKSGDVEAMEQLTMEDMDKFSTVTRRSKKEDIFTIVDSFFMPHTVECDKYSVLGEITDVTEMKNKLTGEELYYMSINCNSIEFELMINKKDLMGVPEKGRRFKGHVWMQGQMDYL